MFSKMELIFVPQKAEVLSWLYSVDTSFVISIASRRSCEDKGNTFFSQRLFCKASSQCPILPRVRCSLSDLNKRHTQKLNIYC